MRSPFVVHAIVSISFFGSACNGGSPGANDDARDAASDVAPVDGGAEVLDVGPPRSFALALTGIQAFPTKNPIDQALAPEVADDADVVAVHQDFYGVPWTALETGAPLPPPWVAAMDALAASAKGKDVFLSLQLGGGDGRQYLADRATVAADGSLAVQRQWGPRCPDLSGDTKTQKAYADYVKWMMAEFKPKWMNVAIEINLFAACLSTSGTSKTVWQGMVDTVNGAYDAAKSVNPKVIAFPSIQIDTLYGQAGCPGRDPNACYGDNLPLIARLKRDRFAISAYPYWARDSIPDDYYSRAAGTEKVVIAETGLDSTPIVANASCAKIFDATPEREDRYLSFVLDHAQGAHMDLVTWWSDRDAFVAKVTSDCPCTFDASWCALVNLGGTDLQFKIFGTMGIRDYDGAPKPTVFAHWQATRARPLVSP